MTQAFPKVEPHTHLEPIIDDIWYLTGSVAFKPLVRLSRNMIVIKNNDELTLINSVRLNKEGEKALDALGKVTHIMKIGFHAMDDPYYLDRYQASYWVAEPLTSEQKDKGVHSLNEDCQLPFPDADVFCFKDTNQVEAAIHIKREDGLLITCDCIQHWVPKKLMSPAAKLVTRLMGFQKPAQIGPPWKKIQTPENGSLRADFERLAALPFKQIIGGHGGLLENDGNALLKATIARELSA